MKGKEERGLNPATKISEKVCKFLQKLCKNVFVRYLPEVSFARKVQHDVISRYIFEKVGT